LGQALFRRNPVGRYIVRRFGNLARALPLSAPQNVMIDICNACNFRCTFCPTGDNDLLKSVGRPKGLMDFALFTKIIDDLKIFNGQITYISLHKDGEPLLNKKIGEMIAYAKAAKVASSIEVTSNASLLTHEMATLLLDAGLDTIRVSVEHVSDQGYKNLVRTYSKYQQIVDNVANLYSERNRRKHKLRILVKILDVGLSGEEKEKFRRDFNPISDVARVENIMGWSHSEKKDFTLGLNPSVGMDGVTPLKKERIVCPEPFKMLAINFNGSVSPCCDDWAHGLLVGNATTTPVGDIWNGRELSRVRQLHLSGRRGELPTCASCQYMQGVTDIFDLDDQRLALLRKYEALSIEPAETPAA
jgi:radical SAM protein with 4Fe4S-binding SPASM domain